MANLKNGNLDLYVKQLLSEALDNGITDDHRPPVDADKNDNHFGPTSKPIHPNILTSHD